MEVEALSRYNSLIFKLKFSVRIWRSGCLKGIEFLNHPEQEVTDANRCYRLDHHDHLSGNLRRDFHAESLVDRHLRGRDAPDHRIQRIETKTE